MGPLIKGLTKTSRIVSVFRPRRGDYDYFAVPHGVQLRIPAPPKGHPAFGEALEALLPSLPAAAAKVGHGEYARGTIVMDRKGSAKRSLGAWVAIVLDRLESGGVIGGAKFNDGTGGSMSDYREGSVRVNLVPKPKVWGRVARFVLHNKGHTTYKVLIIDRQTERTTGTVIVRPHATVQVDIPPGVYYLRCKIYVRGEHVQTMWMRGKRDFRGESLGYLAKRGKVLGIGLGR